MDAFDTGSELSSADEAPMGEAPRRAESSGRARSNAPTPSASAAPAKRSRASVAADARASDQSDEDRPRQRSRAVSGAAGGSEKPESNENSVSEKPADRPRPTEPADTSAAKTRPKPTDEKRKPSATPRADGAASERPPRPASRPPAEAAFAHNMSGWDQLFGPMTSSAPAEPARPKDMTPEQRAAAADAEAQRLRETRAKQAEARAKEREAAEVAAAAERAKEAARAVEARAKAEPAERRAQSVTYVVRSCSLTQCRGSRQKARAAAPRNPGSVGAYSSHYADEGSRPLVQQPGDVVFRGTFGCHHADAGRNGPRAAPFARIALRRGPAPSLSLIHI